MFSNTIAEYRYRDMKKGLISTAEFDDLDAVWTNESLQASFLKLPLAALLVSSVLQSVSWQTKVENLWSINIASAPRCLEQGTFDLYLCLVNVCVCKHAVK